MKRGLYLSALIYYLAGKRREKGAVVVVRTREICGTDRRCGWELRRLMLFLVTRGLARRHRRGIYIMERAAVERALHALSEQI
ncbi:hypothetical protein [Pyrobaculum neutrophilum]|uniref:hypothetical protein n=1 Tax=Pyrobaculum neutrophilum TaxID=70771 RepID=UPI001FE1CB31|nr:hypothetical protein [Pyrobaculum neutrophilum]